MAENTVDWFIVKEKYYLLVKKYGLLAKRTRRKTSACRHHILCTARVFRHWSSNHSSQAGFGNAGLARQQGPVRFWMAAASWCGAAFCSATHNWQSEGIAHGQLATRIQSRGRYRRISDGYGTINSRFSVTVRWLAVTYLGCLVLWCWVL